MRSTDTGTLQHASTSMRISQCIIVERSEDTEAPVEHGMHVGDVMGVIVDS